MKLLRIVFIFFIFLYLNPLYANENKLKNEITKNLRCLVCQGQSVYDSDSEFATSLKLLIGNKIQQNLTEEEIYSFLTDKYGDWILYNPKFNPGNFLLWILPYSVLVLGALIIAFLIRKSSKKA